MVESSWSKIVAVVLKTVEFFNLSLNLDSRLSDHPDKKALHIFAEHKKLIIKLSENIFLIFKPPLIRDKIRVELVVKNLTVRSSDWQTELKTIFDKSCEFTIHGFVSSYDQWFDLTNDVPASVAEDNQGSETAETSLNDDLDSALDLEDLPTAQKVADCGSVCPNCQKELKAVDDLLCCEECDLTFWCCPHCSKLLDEHPAESDMDFCPDCQRTYCKIPCPLCEDAIWSDSEQCPECGKDLQADHCPSCGQKLFVSTKQDDCPYCREILYVCPRCHKYIEVDPEDTDNDMCPLCEKSFWKAICPHCEQEIWTDSEQCPECAKELKQDQCPECDSKLFVSDKQDTCPFCEETLWVCPRCGQYILEDPAEMETCPRCEELLITYDCPRCCHEGIYITTKVCPECEETLDFEECPNCAKQIPSGLETCPFCDDSLEPVDCPHCQKKHYYCS